jgi:type IV pilus assembly protein PilW
VAASSTFQLQTEHAVDPGDIVLVATPDCRQLGYFQAVAAADDYITHTTENLVSPGNCTGELAGTFVCGSGTASQRQYPPGSVLMKLISHAYYVGPSEVSDAVPALFRERLGVVTAQAATWSEELIQGVENLQVQYGIDLGSANSLDVTDIYIKASDGRMDWQKINSVQISLRLRSLQPVYQHDIAYDEFMGITGTDGSDRFLHETFSTTINVRN